MDSKKAKMITFCHSLMEVINYFENVRLNDSCENGYLIELCKKDLIGIRSGKITTRPFNIQDELVLGRIYEADKNDLLDLFNKKFEKAKDLNGFKTYKTFAKYEYKFHQENQVLRPKYPTQNLMLVWLANLLMIFPFVV